MVCGDCLSRKGVRTRVNCFSVLLQEFTTTDGFQLFRDTPQKERSRFQISKTDILTNMGRAIGAALRVD